MTTAYTAASINSAHAEWVRTEFPQLVRAEGTLRAFPVVVFTIDPVCRVLHRAPVEVPEGTPMFIDGFPFPQAWAGDGAPWWAAE